MADDDKDPGFGQQSEDQLLELLRSLGGNGEAMSYEDGGDVTNRDPTDQQKRAGNYKKAHINVHGLPISIENEKGSTRRGVDKGGSPWQTVMPAHYGYLKRTEGADRDPVDVYLGPNPLSKHVWIVDQRDPETQAFDEHKVMLGFEHPDHARDAYHGGFSDGSGPDRVGGVTHLHINQFKDWLKNGDTRKPVSYRDGNEAEQEQEQSFAEGGAVEGEEEDTNPDDNEFTATGEDAGALPPLMTPEQAKAAGAIAGEEPDLANIPIMSPEEAKAAGAHDKPQVSTGRAAFLAARRSALPALGSLPAMAAGAEVGATLGLAGGPAAPVTVPLGGIIGGAAGALGGGYVLQKLQNAVWPVSEEEQAGEEQHPYASLAGSLAPNVVAFQPGKLGASLAQRALGGGIMGGLEAGQELATEGEVDPTKVGIATGFGAVMNKPTRIGRAGMNLGVKGAVAVETSLRRSRAGAQPAEEGQPGRPDLDSNKVIEEPVVDNPQTIEPEALKAEGEISAPPLTSRGTSESRPAPPSADRPVATLETTRSSREYPKGEQPSETPENPGNKSLTYGDLPEDQVTALLQSTRRGPAPSAETDTSRPMLDMTPKPQPAEPVPPVQSGIVEAAAGKPMPAPGVEAPGGRLEARPATEQLPPVEQRPRRPKLILKKKAEPANIAEVPVLTMEQAKAAGAHIPQPTVDSDMAVINASRTAREAQGKALNKPAEGREGKAFEEAPPLSPEQEAVADRPAVKQEQPAQATVEPPKGKATRPTLKLGPAEKAEPIAAEPAEKVAPARDPSVQRAIDVARQKNMHRLADELERAHPDNAKAFAREAMRTLQPQERPTVAGLEEAPKTSGEVDARKKSRAVAAAKSAFEAFPPADDVIPTSKEQKAALKERLTNAIAHATEENLGQDPLSYKPRVEPPHSMWLRAAKRLVAGRMTARQVAEFVATEKQLRSGQAEDVQNVRDSRRIESDIGLRRGPSVEQAEARQAREITPEEAEQWGHTEEITPEKLSRDPSPTDAASEVAQVAENVIKTVDRPKKVAPARKAGEAPKPSEGAASDVRKVAITPELKAKYEADIEKASKAAPIRDVELARLEKPKSEQELRDFWSDEKGALDHKKVAQAIRAKQKPLTDWWVRNIQPEMVSNVSRVADPLFAKFKSRQAQEHTAYTDLMAADWHRWENAPLKEQLDFMDRIQRGAQQATTQHDIDAKFYRKLYDDAYNIEAKYGSAAEYVENYFTQIWKDVKKANAFIEARKQALGPTWFQKERMFETIKEGMKAGLELRSTNPAELVTRRMLASADMVTRVQLLHDLQSRGVAFPRTEAPEWARKSGEWESVIAPDHNEWLLAPDIKYLWENAVHAKGLWENQTTVGDAFRGWMMYKNATVPLKLMLSAFHPLHVLHLNWNHNMMRGLQHEGLVGMLKAAPSFFEPLLPNSDAFKLGSAAREAWKKLPENMTPREQYHVQALNEMGIVPQMSEQLRVKAERDFKSAIAKMDYKALPLAGFRRGIELLQKPIFEVWIPNLKTAAALRDYAALLKKRPDLIHDERQRLIAARYLGKQVDDRFGEMFYGSLFWNRIGKDVATGSMLSLGWNLGFGRQFGGAAIEAARTLASPVLGARTGVSKLVNETTNKVSYVTSYVATSMILAGVMSYALSGELPKGLDYVFPRAGGVNPDGSPRRLTTMYFTREWPMLVHHKQEEQSWLKGLGAMLWGKMILAPVVEALQNRDYFGNELYDPHANWFKQWGQLAWNTVGNAINPITFTGAERARETGGTSSYVGAGVRAAKNQLPGSKKGAPENFGPWYKPSDETLSFAGFGPAPAYAQRDEMQNRIIHAFRNYGIPEVRPYEDRPVQDARREARGELHRAQLAKDPQAIAAAMKNLQQTGMSPRTIAKQKPGMQDVYYFSRIPPAIQKQLVSDMTTAEFRKYVLGASPVRGKDRATLILERRKQFPNEKLIGGE